MVRLLTPEDGLSDNEEFNSHERAKGLETWTFECRYGKAVMVPEQMTPMNYWCAYKVTFYYNNGLIVQDEYLRNMKHGKKKVRVHIERRMDDKKWGDFKEQEDNIRNEIHKDDVKRTEKELEDERARETEKPD